MSFFKQIRDKIAEAKANKEKQADQILKYLKKYQNGLEECADFINEFSKIMNASVSVLRLTHDNKKINQMARKLFSNTIADGYNRINEVINIIEAASKDKKAKEHIDDLFDTYNENTPEEDPTRFFMNSFYELIGEESKDFIPQQVEPFYLGECIVTGKIYLKSQSWGVRTQTLLEIYDNLLRFQKPPIKGMSDTAWDRFADICFSIQRYIDDFLEDSIPENLNKEGVDNEVKHKFENSFIPRLNAWILKVKNNDEVYY